MTDYVNVRIWKDTRRLLRLIAAESGEQMVQVMQRLCEAEWQRLNPDKAQDRAQPPPEKKSTEPV